MVLGGDCTTGVGTALAGVDALLYLDLHADLNTPASVPDGALDWTGVAHLLGEADAVPGLTGGAAPLRPDQVVLLGLDREQSTSHERARLDALGLPEVPVARLRDDPEAAAAAALELLPARSARVAVHFDVDVVDFTDAPLSENVGRGIGVPLAAALAALAVLHGRPARRGAHADGAQPAARRGGRRQPAPLRRGRGGGGARGGVGAVGAASPLA